MARPFLDFVHPDDREQTEREAALITTGDFTASFTNRYRTKDGGWRWIEWASKADMEQRLIYASARDVTERGASDERARREAEERFRRAFEDSAVGHGAWWASRARRPTSSSRRTRAWPGSSACPVDELVGTPTLRDLADPEDVERIAEGMRAAARRARASLFRCEFRIRRPDGRRVWVDLTTSLVRDEDGRPLYRLSQVVDIDARKQAAEQLQYLADHDALSGVFNRRRFEQELERELGHAAARGGQGAVLLLDVDRLQGINDTLGHAVGRRRDLAPRRDLQPAGCGRWTWSRGSAATSSRCSCGGSTPEDAIQVASGLRELASSGSPTFR